MPSLRDEFQHLGGSIEMHWLENTVRDLRRVLGPWGHKQPLMALTSINLDTFLFYFQLFLSTLWHPAVLFVLELWQIGLFPTSGIFISCSSLTMSSIAPLHANYQACFLWLIFAVASIFELLCPFSHLYNISALKNKEHFFMQFEISEAHIIRIGPKMKCLWEAEGDEWSLCKICAGSYWVSLESDFCWLILKISPSI